MGYRTALLFFDCI